MKRMNFLQTAALSCICIAMASCGGSKQVTSTQPESSIIPKIRIELDPCDEYALGRADCAVGTGVDFNESFAKTYAEGQARGELARAIAAAIRSTSGENTGNYAKASSSGNKGAQVGDTGSKGESEVRQIAEQTVKNTKVVKMSKYMRADGAYEIHVCVEYQGGASKMAEEITRKVEQQISDDERMKMNFEFEKYRERMEKALKEEAERNSK